MFSPFAYMGSHGTPPVILYDIELYGDDIITSQAILESKLTGESLTYFDRTGTNVKANSSTTYTISQNFSGSTATSIRMAKATGLNVTNTFRYVPNLITVDFPDLTNAGAGSYYMFRDNLNLTTGYFDSLVTLGGTMFYGCSGITKVHAVESGSGIIYMPSVTEAGLNGVNVFYGTGLSGSFSTVSASADNYLPLSGSNALGNSMFGGCKDVSQWEMINCPDIKGFYSGVGAYNLINPTASTVDPNAGIYIPDATIITEIESIGLYKLHLSGCTTVGKISGLTQYWETISDTDTNADVYVPDMTIMGSYFGNRWGNSTSAISMSMYLPNVTQMLSTYHFSGCTKIFEFSCHPSYSADVWLPNCNTFGSGYNFSNCSNLNQVYLSGFSTLPSYTFYGCSSLTSVSQTDDTADVYMPDITSLRNTGIFYNCSSLTSVDIPYVVDMQSGTIFYNCTSLNYINAPALTSAYIGNTAASNNVFLNCALSGSATFPVYYATNNAGAPDGDIQYLTSRGWTITYV